jgi:hypothetical protein
MKDLIEEYESELEDLCEEKQYLSDLVLLNGWSEDIERRQNKVRDRIDLLLESIQYLQDGGSSKDC